MFKVTPAAELYDILPRALPVGVATALGIEPPPILRLLPDRKQVFRLIRPWAFSR